MRRRPRLSRLAVAPLLVASLAWAQTGAPEAAKRPQPAEPEDAPTTVTVDLTGLEEAAYQRLDGLALEKRLVLRLVQDGYAVLSATAAATVHLSLTAAEGAVQLHARSPVCPDEQRQVTLGDAPLGELHLELAQKAADLTRACTPPPPAPPVVRPPAPPSPLSVTGAAGLEFRGGGLDPTAQLAVRYGRLVGGELAAVVVPSRGEGLWVLDTRLLVGLSLRLDLPQRFTFDGALHVGAQLRAWRADEGDAGVRVDLALALPLALTWWPLPRLGIGVRVAPGLALADPGGISRAGTLAWSRGVATLDTLGLLSLRL